MATEASVYTFDIENHIFLKSKMIAYSINAILILDLDFVFQHEFQQWKVSPCCQNHSVNPNSKHPQSCLG